jgi:hypothetical protein
MGFELRPPPGSPTPSTHPNSSETEPWPLPETPRGSIVSSAHWRSSTRTRQTVGTATGLVDATNTPLATVDGVIRPVLVDPGAEAGRAEFEQQQDRKKEPPAGGFNPLPEASF